MGISQVSCVPSLFRPKAATQPLADGDALMVRRTLEGDRHAFADLYVKYRRRIFSLCYHYLGHAEDAEDATQEAFVRAYRGLRGFRQGCRFSTWLTQIAINTCRSRGARRNRLRDREMEMPEDQEILSSEEPGDPWTEGLRHDEVRQVLQRMPDKFRLVLTLRYFQDLSYEEMCETLGWPLTRVKATLNRARNKFKEAYIASESAL
ncbi:MAG TPA: RNA polymerase sigma factor [Armatimonadota bacterium]|jgi:RNA polymerase sigma-70 factor (ECF subfamily)